MIIFLCILALCYGYIIHHHRGRIKDSHIAQDRVQYLIHATSERCCGFPNGMYLYGDYVFFEPINFDRDIREFIKSALLDQIAQSMKYVDLDTSTLRFAVKPASPWGMAYSWLCEGVPAEALWQFSDHYINRLRVDKAVWDNLKF